MKSKWLSYILKILWVVGLILLAIISFNYQNQIQQTASETFNMVPTIWIEPLISIIFGFYISFIVVKKWSLSVNLSLLWCVAIPCLILTLSLPILVTLSSVNYFSEIPITASFSFGLQKIYSTNAFGIIAGLTIILSLFNSKANNQNQ